MIFILKFQVFQQPMQHMQQVEVIVATLDLDFRTPQVLIYVYLIHSTVFTL